MNYILPTIIHLIDPFLLSALLLGLCICMALRNSSIQRVRRLAWVAGLCWLLSTPAFAQLMMLTIDRPAHHPQKIQTPAAIVVLGGGIYPPTQFHPQTEIGNDTTRRCLKAIELYHELKPNRVIVSGGKVDPDEEVDTIAQTMRDFLVSGGVPADKIVMEQASRNTHDNIAQTTKLLTDRDIDSIVLVTDSLHMLRSRSCFQKAGITVTPVASRSLTVNSEWTAWSFLPDTGVPQHMKRISREWVGLAYYKARGWI